MKIDLKNFKGSNFRTLTKVYKQINKHLQGISTGYVIFLNLKLE